jgi:hypothetical protein
MQPTIKRSIVMPEDLYAEVAAMAREEDRTVAKQINRLVREALAARDRHARMRQLET